MCRPTKPDPSRVQIKNHCNRIRRRWDSRKARKRAGEEYEPYTVPRYYVCRNRFGELYLECY
jgi:hypothetical protein